MEECKGVTASLVYLLATGGMDRQQVLQTDATASNKS